ncbi:ArdC-like ssDNA-binding domain-containing protein [Enterococcus raffinosus]|uniref:DUF6782 family putative metallopeptidase n=1 Tax=Enterococcus raffinosus TaxID=71452 RepID=UPI00288CCE2C|nr:DUF6782 family putative metallopeptidase [Enterococcus raffinosus]MDT2525148.1 ArdC-like ssDNA-binding domain-containing protein [Enterococcus raffinosus]MDT2592503.1 ArdC-like ssDNA-binding domain-containing protein [Enterococcus raffinosus]
MTKLNEIVMELRETAVDQIKKANSSTDELVEYLEFTSKFYERSARNQALIYKQRPSAVACLGFSEITKKGLSLNKGAKGIKILVPCFYKEKDKETGKEEEVLKYFKYANVYDITQTNMKPEDYPKLYPNKPQIFNYDFSLDDMWDNLMKLSTDLKVKSVSIDNSDLLNGARGAYYPVSGIILLNNGNTQSQNISTLIHELAHSHLHNLNKKGFMAETNVKETQAEMVAYIVSNFFGMDTSKKSFPYIAEWSDKLKSIKGKDLANIFEEIQNTAKYFITKLNKGTLKKNIA